MLAFRSCDSSGAHVKKNKKNGPRDPPPRNFQKSQNGAHFFKKCLQEVLENHSPVHPPGRITICFLTPTHTGAHRQYLQLLLCLVARQNIRFLRDGVWLESVSLHAVEELQSLNPLLRHTTGLDPHGVGDHLGQS